MSKADWAWYLRFSQWLACFGLLTSLWGCGLGYEIIPSASILPTSAQVQAETERLALPAELRERLDKYEGWPRSKCNGVVVWAQGNCMQVR